MIMHTGKIQMAVIHYSSSHLSQTVVQNNNSLCMLCIIQWQNELHFVCFLFFVIVVFCCCWFVLLLLLLCVCVCFHSLSYCYLNTSNYILLLLTLDMHTDKILGLSQQIHISHNKPDLFITTAHSCSVCAPVCVHMCVCMYLGFFCLFFVSTNSENLEQERKKKKRKKGYLNETNFKKVSLYHHVSLNLGSYTVLVVDNKMTL